MSLSLSVYVSKLFQVQSEHLKTYVDQMGV